MVPVIAHTFVHNYMEQCLKYIPETQELKDIILYVLLMYTRNNSRNTLMKLAKVVIMQYHKIIQKELLYLLGVTFSLIVV